MNIQYPDKVKELKTLLDAWLIETNAKVPVADPQYSPLKERQVKRNWHTNILQRQEKIRMDMLSPHWKPNKDWWGSMITID